MKHAVITSIAVTGLLVCSAVAQTNRVSTMSHSPDNTFVTKAAQGGMAEVELGTLATERASHEKVKQFGRQMVDDHTKINDELKALASSKGTTLPSSMDSKSQSTKNHLSGLSGAAFDRAYMQDMVNDHQQDIAEFQQEIDHGTDSEVKAFASKNLPTLQHHLKLAQEALDAVKKSQ